MQDRAAEAQLVQLTGDSITMILGVDEDNDALLIHTQQMVPQEPRLVIVLADNNFLRIEEQSSDQEIHHVLCSGVVYCKFSAPLDAMAAVRRRSSPPRTLPEAFAAS